MKYTKPKDATGRYALSAFVDSLPAEFEIVEPGNVQVRWPDGLTREALMGAIGWLDGSMRIRIGTDHMVAAFLRYLAAIAPVEKKKRKVWLWEKDHPHYTERSWTSNDIDRTGSGWRKVGECEVDA